MVDLEQLEVGDAVICISDFGEPGANPEAKKLTGVLGRVHEVRSTMVVVKYPKGLWPCNPAFSPDTLRKV